MSFMVILTYMSICSCIYSIRYDRRESKNKKRFHFLVHPNTSKGGLHFITFAQPEINFNVKLQ